MNAVGIDASKGKSMVTILRPFGEIVSSPHEVRHTSDQIDDLIQAYQNRNGKIIRPIVFTKGDRVLMYIVSDPFKNYMKENKHYSLKENKNVYTVRKRNGITELIEKDRVYVKEMDTFIPLHVKLNS